MSIFIIHSNVFLTVLTFIPFHAFVLRSPKIFDLLHVLNWKHVVLKLCPFLVNLIHLVTRSRCLMGLIVSEFCPLFRLLVRGCLTFEKSSIVFISHVVSWALDLSELVKFFVIVILNFLLLIIFFLCKIESFFFELTLYYFLRAFRFHLCLAFFLIDFVIGGLDLNIVLHAFFQQAFVIKSLEHLDQWSNIILVHNIFLNVERLYVLWDLCLPLFLDW